MLKKWIGFITGVSGTVISGVFLIASLVLSKTGVRAVFDPAWITVIISGIPLLYSAVRKMIFNRGISKISSALLISIAMTAAIAIGDLFAAGEVAFIMALGEILEDMTTDRAKKGLNNLISLSPAQGRRIVDKKEEIIPAEQISTGDILRILPGETVAVDGVIISGETSVDQSVMTGESLPVDKGVGDEVFCGTINRFGSIDIRATKVGEDSSLQMLIRLVQQADDKKAPMARIADKCASWLVPVALIIGIITGFASGDITRAVTVLVVFCPCALVLATPTAIMAAIGQATKHGVVIKSGEALEKMGKVDTVVFDKTGTITYGRPEVCDVVTIENSITEHTLLFLAASAEAKSEHPLGKAIVAYAKERNVNISESTDFKMTVGRGVLAEIDGKKIVCGSETFLSECGVILDGRLYVDLDKFRSQGKVSVLVSENGRCLGVIALSDVLRPQTDNVVSKLKDMNTDVVLLTGDNTLTARYFADQVGIEKVCAELLPQQKVEKISELQSDGRTVCMIGDGVNDAPALKCSCVGVAMASIGSDIAIEAADIALMSDDISRITYLKRLSKATVNTIKLSITLSMFINFLAVALSVLGILNPTTGALVHNAGSCFVVLIAALLYDRKFD